MLDNSSFEDLAEIARTLGHSHRLQLLALALSGEHSVEVLAEASKLTLANASQHLQVLKRSGLLSSRRDGKHVLYRLGSGPVKDVLLALKNLFEFQRALVHELSSASGGARSPHTQGVTVEELLRMLRDDSITLIDVRPRKEFNAGHLPGAISIPVEELSARLSELQSGREVVAYCRGPFCVLSSEAVTLLSDRGVLARRLNIGFPEWNAAGLHVEKRRSTRAHGRHR